MTTGKEILLAGIRVSLLPQKAIFLPEYSILMLADLHLGKSAHFRKEGIYMPYLGIDKELDKLTSLINEYRPETIVFLGDLFHSHINSEWDIFKEFLGNYPAIHFILTKGNHDILPVATFENAGLTVTSELVVDELLICTHMPMAQLPYGMVNIAGHIHPGCAISFLGRQQFRLPCFYYYEQVLVLPASGSLTGLHIMQEKVGARIFPILDNEVVEIAC